jgi:hypothetical protein
MAVPQKKKHQHWHLTSRTGEIIGQTVKHYYIAIHHHFSSILL